MGTQGQLAHSAGWPFSLLNLSNILNKTPILQVVFTSCSIVFLKELFLLLKSKGLSGGSLFKVKSSNYGRLLYGTQDSLKLYRIVYNGRYKLFLNRKKLVFERFMKKYAAVAQR